MKICFSVLVLIIFITACKKNSTPTPVPVKPLYDVDGNGYDTVKIGGQYWMKQNLKTAHYRNGDLIPKVTDPVAWAALKHWCLVLV